MASDNLQHVLPDTISQSTTGYTLGVEMRVPTKDTPDQKQDLFVILGRAQNYSTSQSRTLEKIFEINTATGGEAVETIPGGIEEDTISLDRIDVYPLPMILAFGGTEANNLRSQITPFNMVEYIFDPKDRLKSRRTRYINCFLDSHEDPIEIEGGGPITVSGSIQVTDRETEPLFALNDVPRGPFKINDWISFTIKQEGGDSNSVRQQLTEDDGPQAPKTIIDRSVLAGLANICGDNVAQGASQTLGGNAQEGATI